jgi:hypothetical protein
MKPLSAVEPQSRPSRLACVYACVLVVGALFLAWPGAASGQLSDSQCNFSFDDEGAGPFDYRTERATLGVVERRHFTRKVELLQSGESISTPGPDIDYTLRKFPNHHRALLAMSKLSLQLKTGNVPEMRYSVTCHFERAMRFRPDDTVARLIYARHLGLTGRPEEGKSQVKLAATHAKENPLTHYNIGLIALELKDYDAAVKHAQIAYGLGIASPHLRDELTKAGKWTDPASPAQPPHSPAPASTASAASAPAQQ